MKGGDFLVASLIEVKRIEMTQRYAYYDMYTIARLSSDTLFELQSVMNLFSTNGVSVYTSNGDEVILRLTSTESYVALMRCMQMLGDMIRFKVTKERCDVAIVQMQGVRLKCLDRFRSEYIDSFVSALHYISSTIGVPSWYFLTQVQPVNRLNLCVGAFISYSGDVSNQVVRTRGNGVSQRYGCLSNTSANALGIQLF